GGGSNGNISTILVSDTLGTTCFGLGTGPQLQVFYSQFASGAWSTPTNLSGTASSADRGTLVTNGSNVYAAYSTQKHYYDAGCSKYAFDVSEPRIDFFRRSTNNGGTWGSAVKLPGQSSTFRGDYMYMATSGTNVYIATTNVDTGKIILWVSTNSGQSFANPVNVGTTTNKDNTPGQTAGNCPCGYTGGFTGLPAVATNGSAVGVAYTSNPTGAGKVAICNTSGTGCTTKSVAASETNSNYGYFQAAGDSTRMVFTWTTTKGAFSDVWTGGTAGSFGGAKTITTFPDANFAGTACASASTACNQAGTGAIPVLLGTSGVGIALTECNTITTQTGSHVNCDESQSLEKSREILVWYESSNNGTSYGTHALIKTASGASKNPSWMSEYGSVANISGTPYVLWNGHDDIYGAYDVEVKKCTGC
ncbi:MAG TPA: hypothetical protein VGJ67_01005, partial [Actinomycetota bacterium]